MKNITEIKNELENIWKNNDYWKRFIGSQFSDGLATFVSQIVYRCAQYANRRLQESFLSKATNKSSILAAAEDKAYVGLRISPSKGQCLVTNKRTERLTLPQYTALQNDGTDYLLTVAIDINAGASILADTAQLKIETVKQNVDIQEKWRTVLLDKTLTSITHKVDVFVNGELWEKRYKFRNTTGESKAYMEYYTSTEQIGIRFGNGINGKMPDVGDEIELRVWTTDGQSTLLDGQEMKIVDSRISDTADIEIKTSTSITGGANGDSIEDIRQGALYTTAYDHQLAWDGDYRQFIKDNVGGLIWLSVWGEEQQEKLTGKDARNINCIFFSAYSDVKTDEQLEEEIVHLFDGREGYNEKYVWKDRVDNPFTLEVIGKTTANGDPEAAEIYLKEKLNDKYGKDTKDKPNRILIDDIWDFIHGLKQQVFITEFTVTATNLTVEELVGHYSYLDIDSSNIKFTYQKDR